MEKNTMKKRTVLTTILAIVCCISCIFFAACKQKVTVSFQTEGSPIAAVQVVKGETYTLQRPAAREGYEFQGWYLTADFSGDPVTSVKVEKDITVYAKWEQVATVRLDPAGGTLSVTTLKSSVGKKVLDLVKDYKPVKEGAQFYAWYSGSRIVNEDTVVSAGTLVLTAKYKYKYSVVVRVESAEESGETKNYVKDDVRSFEGYELEGESISAPRFSGLKLVSGNGGTVKAVGTNEFVFDYDRENVSVIFNSNYPGNTDDIIETQRVRFGTAIKQFPFTPEYDGYLFVGWSKTINGAADYPVYLGADKVYNLAEDETRPADGEIVVDNNLVLYAVWSKAYTNMFVNSDAVSDLVFVVDEPGTRGTVKVAYLYRGGKYFKGSYSSSSKNFEFRPAKDSNSIIGRIVNEANYVYRSDAESDTTDYYEYKLEAGLFSMSARMDTSSIMRFDRYNGVEYIRNAGADNEESSKGTYVVGTTAYEVTFSEGDLAGETIYFVRGEINGNHLFQIRDEEEYGKTFNMAYVNKNNLVITSRSQGYYIELDGYGGGILHAGTQTQQIYCFYDANGNLDVFINGSRSGKLAVIEQNGAKGYISYSSALAHTFESGNRKLTLDGSYGATYYDGRSNHEGAYTTYLSSSLGGTVVEFYDADERAYYFLVKSVANAEGSYDYTLEEVASNYAEMSYVRGTSMVGGRLFVINGETMIVYGVNRNRQYVELARGNYIEQNGEMIFEVTSALTAEEIAEKEIQPVELEESSRFFFEYSTDFTNIERATFRTNRVTSNGSAVNVLYWTVIEFKGESSDLNEATEYTSVKGGSSKLYVFGNRLTHNDETDTDDVALGVFATFIDEAGNSYSGLFMQSSSFRYLSVSVTNNGTTSTRYFAFDMDVEAKTFLLYDYLPVSAYAVDKNGNLTPREYLTLDGKGGASHVTVKTGADGGDEEFSVDGTIVLTGEKVSGVSVYKFTANDGSEEFETIIFTAGNYNAFAKKSNNFIGDYTMTVGEQRQTLTLDGYVLARLSTEDQTSGSMYYFTTDVENQIMLIINSNQGSFTYYIDLDQTNRTYTIRGSVYGNYMFIKNQSATGMWFELDGYGTVKDYDENIVHAVIKDYKKDEKGNFLRDKDGNYIEYTVSDEATYKFDTENGKTYVYIKYKSKNSDNSDKDYVIYKGILTTVTSGSSTYAAFVEVETEVEEIYVNNDDWSMLVLTSYGVARKIDGRTGTAVNGSYILIKDGLLYFRTDSESGLFEYNTDDRTIRKLEYRNQGYYTEDLYSFYFSKEGYADYAKGSERIRYYYTIESEEAFDDDGNKITKENVTLYYQDWYNSEHNDYGFVVKEFGYHDSTAKDWAGDHFYTTDGAEVSFARNAENSSKYAITSGGTKYKFGKITFRPNGSDEFSIAVTVDLLLENGEPYTDANGKAQTLSGYIRREILEREVVDGDVTTTEQYFHSYLQFATNDGGNFTFDVDLSFVGKEGSTYSINNEEWVMSGSGYRYNEGMMTLYLNYFQTGRLDSAQLAAIQSLDYGTLTFKRIFDENGDEVLSERRIIAEFTDEYNPLQNEDGSYWTFLDQQSSKPTTKGEGENRKNVTVIEAKGFEILNGAFKFGMKDKDGNDYMIAVRYQSSQYFSSYGFYFDAISTYNEFEKEVNGKNYKVAVERIQWTENENSNTVGRMYWVSVGEVGKDNETVSYAAYGYGEDGLVDYDSRWILVREIGEVEVTQTTGTGDDKKTETTTVNRYISSKLFKVKFAANGLGEHPAYDELVSLTVEELNVVYDNQRGTSFFEYTVDSEGNVKLATYGVYQAMYGGYRTFFAKTNNYVKEGNLEYVEATFFGDENTYYAEITRNEDGTIAAMVLLTEKPAAKQESEQAA